MGNCIPKGSYKLTCKDIKVTLSCKAQTIEGSWIPASFDLTDVSDADLWNDNGVLKNSGTATSTGYIPSGSYKLTCKDIKVKLTCKAQTIEGSWIPASFDLTNLTDADLWNDNGVLKNACISEKICIYAYGNFGQPAGNHPDQQAEDYKTWLDALGKAGFNVLVMSTFHVDPSGNLDDSAPVANGGVFNPLESTNPEKALNPKLPELLADFKSTFNAKVYYSIGNWAGSNGDMANVAVLLDGYSCMSSGSKPSNSNYDNFVTNLKLLKSALHIDGIDFDFEPHDTPDAYGSGQQKMVSQFTCLLHSLGFGVTYCPYTSKKFWINAQADACDPNNTGTGTSKVNWWNLQCYDGGSGNTADGWVDVINDNSSKGRLGIADTGKFITPGYGKNSSSAGEVQQNIYNAATGSPESKNGGFIWQLGDFISSPNMESALADYANAIINGRTNP